MTPEQVEAISDDFAALTARNEQERDDLLARPRLRAGEQRRLADLKEAIHQLTFGAGPNDGMLPEVAALAQRADVQSLHR